MNKKIPSYDDLEQAKLTAPPPLEPFDPNNVRKRQCLTCPFRPYGEGIGSDHMTEKEYYEQQAWLVEQSLQDSSQYCHEPIFLGKPQHAVCRGARDIQARFMCATGVLASPTDEAWKQELKNRNPEKQ